jgi:DNA-binding GntR family transcriptional regulator
MYLEFSRRRPSGIEERIPMELRISKKKTNPADARGSTGDPRGLAALYGANLRNLGRAEAVYEVLCAAIRQRRFHAGERIREEEIAEALGVSRTPVREALHRLESRGLIELVGRGFAVVQPDRRQTFELYAVREILEGSAARFAAQHASEPEISVLHRLNQEFADALGEPERLATINRAFHQALNDAAHNRYLTQLLNELHDTLGLLPGTTLTAPGRAAAAHDDHARLIAAIERHDADEAEQIARDHIKKAQQLRLTLATVAEDR